MKVSIILWDAGFRENFYTVDCMNNQTYKNFEILWIEYFSKANTSLLQKTKEWKNIRIICLNDKFPWIAGKCVNEGIRQSTGELIVIMDADVIVKRDFLEILVNEHLKNERLMMHFRRWDELGFHRGLLEWEELKKVSVCHCPNNYGGCISVGKKWLLKVNGCEEYPIFQRNCAAFLDLYTRLSNLGLTHKWHEISILLHPWHNGTLPVPEHLRVTIQREIINKRAKTKITQARVGLYSKRIWNILSAKALVFYFFFKLEGNVYPFVQAFNKKKSKQRRQSNDEMNKTKIASMFNEIKKVKSNERIVIYGSGIHTVELFNNTNILSKNIIYLIDNSIEPRENEFFHNFYVFNPEKILEIEPDVVIISSFKYQEQMILDLKHRLKFQGKIISFYDQTDQGPFYFNNLYNAGVTISNQYLPNFFIVGAAKAGTTSLWSLLKNHPQVFMPEDELFKEPGYFSTPLYGISNYQQYLSLFKNAKPEQIRIGEASTSYLTCPDSAKRIKDYFDENKIDGRIIIMLRNPASRAYSLYCWMCKEGYEHARSFKVALDLEDSRKQKNIPNDIEKAYYYNYLYFESGLYYEQIKRYYDTFGKEKLFIIIAEKLFMEPASYLNKLACFLGIDSRYIMKTIERENESVRVFSPYLQLLLRNYISKYRCENNKQFQKKADRDKILKIGQLPLKPKPIPTLIKNNLIERYRDDILKLEKLINEDLLIWNHSLKE
jgi:hypothetical protein